MRRFTLVTVLAHFCLLSGQRNIATAQTLTTLHSFSESNSDGADPSGLVQGSDGNFYGTTLYGGTNDDGTIFRISLGGSLRTLHTFTGGSDGGAPAAGLVQGSDGNFYGTTQTGGTNGVGMVFRISLSGSLTTLYSFTGGRDGSGPSGLTQGTDGNFYGTTALGGTNDEGTVFRISPSGTLTTLWQFCSIQDLFGDCLDGSDPTAGLVQGSDGNFYGTTDQGDGSGFGTVFRISPSGSLTTLHSFNGSDINGYGPDAGLVQGSDGNFYGTTYEDGDEFDCPGGCGTLFRISPSGGLTTLYVFNAITGPGLFAGLVQGSDGNFYGTTLYGGVNGVGSVFKLSIPLSPVPNQITGVQLSGTNIIFNIPSIAYETYQLQFSSSMNPTNWVNVPVSVTNSIGALLTLTNFGGASQPQGFYRFDITP